MGQSLIKNYVHIVFSTKHRQPLIQPPYEDRLHGYLVNVCKRMGCPALAVGGYTDHVHILSRLSQKTALMDLLKELKQTSSKWIKGLDPTLAAFYWQNGYGAFSVSPAKVNTVIHYIRNQHEHHQQEDFKTEFRKMLTTHQIEFDERYLWD